MINKPSLLIIDKDIVFSASVLLRLEKEISIFTATNAKDGLAAINTQSFSLVMLDLDLPDKDGLDVLKEIRQKRQDLSVLVVTGKSSDEYIIKCAQLQVLYFKEKPCDIEELVKRIKKLTGIEETEFLQKLWGEKYEQRMASMSYRIKNALDYIHQNYGRDLLTRNEVSGHINVSPDYLSRRFNAECGVCLKDYIALYRVAKSKQFLLKRPIMKIKDIAVSVGISDVNHFYKFFKKHTGLTIREFRNNSLK